MALFGIFMACKLKLGEMLLAEDVFHIFDLTNNHSGVFRNWKSPLKFSLSPRDSLLDVSLQRLLQVYCGVAPRRLIEIASNSAYLRFFFIY